MLAGISHRPKQPPHGWPSTGGRGYLSRYTHRVAISNSRLIACDGTRVTFKYKDYRAKGRDRQKTMSLKVPEFIRRFLSHVLPKGFHRIPFAFVNDLAHR